MATDEKPDDMKFERDHPQTGKGKDNGRDNGRHDSKIEELAKEAEETRRQAVGVRSAFGSDQAQDE